MQIAEGKNPKQAAVRFSRSGEQMRSSLCSRRNDWPHKIKAVDCGCYAVERSDFARQRVYAECFGAGSHEYGCTALFFARKREGEFDVRSGVERNV
jgi:hypothetical protein